MKNISHLVLSDYQRAILNEMGITSWQLVNEQQTQEKVDNKPHKILVTVSEVTTTENALAKLKQLKTQTQTQTQKPEITDSILVTLSTKDVQLQVFTDVLIALRLETKSQKHISTEQLSCYSDYPLSWAQGEKVSFDDKKLTTPALSDLHHPDTKKLLWQRLHSASSLLKN
jgi:DNA polymerase III psi subunit